MRDVYSFNMSKYEAVGYEKGYVYFSFEKDIEYMCAGHNDFPGKKASFRIDKHRMVKMESSSCTKLWPLIEKRLKNGRILRIEYFTWPYEYPRVAEINLTGFERNLNKARVMIKKKTDNPNISDRDLYGISK
jgi:hypothetical protein